MLTAAMPPPLQAEADAARARHAPQAALRAPAHLGLFRLLPGLMQDALLRDLKAVCDTAAPVFRLRPPARWDGLWVVPLEAGPLDTVRDALAARWHGLLLPGDAATPRLHISIGRAADAPAPLAAGPWTAPALLLWRHDRALSPGPGYDRAFWTPLVACRFRR
jgi:hypothetical protein